jgi:hypothetical protein
MSRTREPTVPMTPAALPQQRLSLVVGLPQRPEPFAFAVGYGGFPPGVVPARGVPRSPVFLVQTEWADTPTNNGVEAYYLQARRKVWLLWLRTLDDNRIPWGWNWQAVGYCPRRGVSEAVAARHLLLEYWRFNMADGGRPDPLDWIDQEGMLSVSDIRAIVRALDG